MYYYNNTMVYSQVHVVSAVLDVAQCYHMVDGEWKRLAAIVSDVHVTKDKHLLLCKGHSK